MRKVFIIGAALLAATSYSCIDPGPVPDQADCGLSDLESRPINEFQVIASHNSYRKRTNPAIFNLLTLGTAILPDEWIPDGVNPAVQWDYHHEPLDAQFNRYNVRSIELDLYNDPEGGLYATRLLNALAGQPVEVNIPVLHQPGIKVMHIAHMDYETHYLTFRRALEAVLLWSDNHPDHFPIYIMMELKDRSFPFDIPGLVQPFNDDNVYRIADEILEVIPREKLITPEDMRTEATLEASIQLNGWPVLAEARGKLFFIAMGSDEIEGTVFGSNSSPTVNANHIFKIRNYPVGDFDRIRDLVRQGFMVRTRADAGTSQARSGNTTTRDMAMASGAQIISTDYYRPDFRYFIFPDDWTDYHVQWPGGMMARSNADTDCFVVN
jgi:hypothetical protein